MPRKSNGRTGPSWRGQGGWLLTPSLSPPRRQPLSSASPSSSLASSSSSSSLLVLSRRRNPLIDRGTGFLPTKVLTCAQKMVSHVFEIFVQPVELVDCISGLRHVGYAIPGELFPPFVIVCSACFRKIDASETGCEVLGWPSGVSAKTQTRTITEGTPVAMKAVCGTSPHARQKSP